MDCIPFVFSFFFLFPTVTSRLATSVVTKLKHCLHYPVDVFLSFLFFFPPFDGVYCAQALPSNYDTVTSSCVPVRCRDLCSPDVP